MTRPSRHAYPDLPAEVVAERSKALRLELWTLFFLATIVAAMYLVMGSSQAMKSAWIEDLLSLIPPIMFLLAVWLERKPPTKYYPFGFHRVGSLAFFASALALLAMGLFLVYEATITLIKQEHPTISSSQIFGQDIWNGWLMIIVLIYSVIPPVILGHLKKRPARKIRDKVLHADASMNAADWQTGLAGAAGVLGISLGYWWADAVAAGLISLSIMKDGFSNSRIAIAELIDGVPRDAESNDIQPVARLLSEKITKQHPGAAVRIRESGRYLRAVIVTTLDEEATAEQRKKFVSDDEVWRLIEISRSLEIPAALHSLPPNPADGSDVPR